MAVAAGQIRSEAFKTIYNLVNANKITASGTYPAFPQTRTVQYPLYTIETDSLDSRYKSFAGVTRGKTINMLIQCFSKSAEQLDQIADELENILESNRAVTMASGLNALTLTQSTVEHATINDELVHAYTFNANYKIDV